MTEGNLWNRAFNKTPATLAQAFRAAHGESEVPVDGILPKIAPGVIELFYSRKRELKANKMECFKGSLTFLMENGYSPEQVVMVDERCVDKDGSINLGRFKALLDEMKNRSSWENNI